MIPDAIEEWKYVQIVDLRDADFIRVAMIDGYERKGIFYRTEDEYTFALMNFLNKPPLQEDLHYTDIVSVERRVSIKPGHLGGKPEMAV